MPVKFPILLRKSDPHILKLITDYFDKFKGQFLSTPNPEKTFFRTHNRKTTSTKRADFNSHQLLTLPQLLCARDIIVHFLNPADHLFTS